MPLKAEDRKRTMGNSFRTVILGAILYDLKILPRSVHALMMSRINTDIIGKICGIKPAQNGCRVGTDRMIEVAVCGQMQTVPGHILNESAAESDIYELHAFADAQYGFLLLHAELECLKLQNIQFGIYLTGALVLFAEKGRSDVTAAGKKQSGTAGDGFGIQGGQEGKTVFG